MVGVKKLCGATAAGRRCKAGAIGRQSRGTRARGESNVLRETGTKAAAEVNGGRLRKTRNLWYVTRECVCVCV